MGLPDEIALLLLKAKAIKFDFKRQTIFASGVESPIYIDNRVVISYPDLRNRMLQGFQKLIDKEIGQDRFDIISGTAKAALPYAAMIAQKLNKPMVYVRAKEKAHGKENIIEGVVRKNQLVLVVEDHISTGGSAINNVFTLREAGAKVNDCLVITSYGLKLAEGLFKRHKIKLHVMTDFKTIIKIAERKKIISPYEKKKLVAWWKDPVTWAFN